MTTSEETDMKIDAAHALLKAKGKMIAAREKIVGLLPTLSVDLDETVDRLDGGLEKLYISIGRDVVGGVE